MSCVRVMWMLKVDSSSEFLLQQLLILRNDTSRWFIKHTFRVWSKLQFCIFVIFFSIVTFYTVFVVASKIQLITFYCSLLEWLEHYRNVIMSVMASQIISLTIVYWIVYSGTDQRKHQSSASLAFVGGIHRWPVNTPHKGPVTRSMFPFDDVVMIQHTDVSWTSWEMILDFGHRLIFLILATFRLCESGQICDFRAFSWEHNKEWPQIWHVGVFWPPSEQIRFWSRYVDFWNAWEEWPKIWHVDVSWPPLELITFGSWSTDFPHFGAIFT